MKSEICKNCGLKEFMHQYRKGAYDIKQCKKFEAKEVLSKKEIKEYDKMFNKFLAKEQKGCGKEYYDEKENIEITCGTTARTTDKKDYLLCQKCENHSPHETLKTKMNRDSVKPHSLEDKPVDTTNRNEAGVSLGDKRCNILINSCLPPEWGSEEDNQGIKLIITDEDELKFEKGFFEKDVKEFIKDIPYGIKQSIERGQFNEVYFEDWLKKRVGKDLK